MSHERLSVLREGTEWYKLMQAFLSEDAALGIVSAFLLWEVKILTF